MSKADSTIPSVNATAMAEPVAASAVNLQAFVVGNEKMAIPDHFMRLACMACSCSNCDFPSCLGCSASGSCLCCEGYSVACKNIKHEEACCINYTLDLELVYPRTLIKMYEQFLCFECFCAIPPEEVDYRAAPKTVVKINDLTVIDDVTVCSGGCCSIGSCNCDFPDCALDGCYQKSVCCCLSTETLSNRWMCCKKEKINQDTCCVLHKGQSLCVMPSVCCKSFNRCCSCDNRCAFPCDKEVPCVFTLLPGCVVCVNGQCAMACCEKLEKLKIDHVAGYVPNPPAGTATATRQPMHAQTVTAQPM